MKNRMIKKIILLIIIILITTTLNLKTYALGSIISAGDSFLVARQWRRNYRYWQTKTNI